MEIVWGTWEGRTGSLFIVGVELGGQARDEGDLHEEDDRVEERLYRRETPALACDASREGPVFRCLREGRREWG